MPRLRDLGLKIGHLPVGPKNSITDIEGVWVGHSSIHEGADIHTGVTALLPRAGHEFERRLVASAYTLNGAGEVFGISQIKEWGLIETPILLTNTLSVGVCADTAVRYLLAKYPDIARTDDVCIPIVGECDDSWLNSAWKMPITPCHVEAALQSASDQAVEEGSVGAGSGMITCGFKAGIGSSSRLIPVTNFTYRLGVLVQSNWGKMAQLRFQGREIGEGLARQFQKLNIRNRIAGSIIVLLATDAPLNSHQLHRISKRAALGISRVGSTANHGSGDFVISFTTAHEILRKSQDPLHHHCVLRDDCLDDFFQAAADATEESIWNALLASEACMGRSEHMAPKFPVESLQLL